PGAPRPQGRARPPGRAAGRRLLDVAEHRGVPHEPLSRPKEKGIMASDHLLTRRAWLRRAALGMTGVSLSGWLGRLAAAAAAAPRRKRSCILLWMAGGPSTTDLWDLKPGHANGGPFKEIDTAAAGVRISEHLPQLARQTNHLAVLRSMRTRE